MVAVRSLLGLTSATCKNATKFFPVRRQSPFDKDLLADKTCLITAGNSSISAALARCFIDHGAKVFISERGQIPTEAASRISNLTNDSQIGALQCDALDEAKIQEAFAYIEKEAQLPCNVLVNYHPLEFTARSQDISVADIQTICDSLATSTFLLTKSLYARNAYKVPTTVLNISTNFANGAIPFGTICGMASAAVEAMTRSLSNEFAKGGLRINAVSVGSALSIENEVKGSPTSDIISTPIGRHVHVEEIARAATFLCSDFANAITGACVTVDGGERHILHPNNLLHGLAEDEWKELLTEERNNIGSPRDPGA